MKYRSHAAVAALIGSLTLSGCEQLPGSREEQSTAIGGAAGAAAGAALSENSLFGALLGGIAGAAGGNLIGARTDWFQQDGTVRRDQVNQALEEAQRDPATVADVFGSDSADLNQDGLVTTDEVLAMEEADLSDREILDRLQATDQVFELTAEQRENLVAAGLSRELVEAFEDVNREQRELLTSNPEVLGSPA